MLDDKELEKGYWLTVENAKSLIDEATILKEKGLYSRAYTLFQMAVEECGKTSIIYNAILRFYQGTQIDQKFLNENGFVDHKEKIDQSLRIEMAAIFMYEKDLGEKSGLMKEVIGNFNRVTELNSLKNNSLYIFIKDNKFVSPNNIITEALVKDIEYSANLRHQVAKQIFGSLETTVKVAEELNKIMDDPHKLKEWEDKAFKNYRE
jgi:AbiV family abortive infection protein